MASARFPGISYTRFSDPIQAKGDSETRQGEMFRHFCQRHNLTPLAEIFADRGRSGYKDEHRKKGRLGQLIAMAKDGRFDPGTVVVVEAWDRLGRLRPDRQTDLVAELLRTGVRIGVCRLDDIFSEEDFGTHKWTTLAVFIQLAYQESKQKSERLAHSWKTRRENGGIITAKLPAWMEMKGGEPRLIPERAAVIRRIFQMSADGYGNTKIVSTLHREGVPSFGEAVVNPGRSRSQFSGKWTRPYVRLILNDRRALGEFQPHKIDGTPEGPPRKGYFPAVVSEDEFLLAQAGLDGRATHDRNGRSLGPRQGKYVNVFKSLLKHARDGEGFLLHNKGTGDRPELLLVNNTGNDGRTNCYTFPYPIFEKAILRRLREVNPADVLPKEKEAPSKVDVLRARLVNVRQDMARIKEDLKEGYSKGLASVLRDHEATEEGLANELQEELARSVKPASRAWKEFPDLAAVVEDSEDPEGARLKLRPVLRRVVEEMWVLIVRNKSIQYAAVQVFFVGGAHREYLVVCQPAAFRRKGWWTPLALPDVMKPGDLDLRKKGHARRLEKALLSIDTAALAERARKKAAESGG
jgi:DNA invertase Pin-like site-specific DNA recombinase